MARSFPVAVRNQVVCNVKNGKGQHGVRDRYMVIYGCAQLCSSPNHDYMGVVSESFNNTIFVQSLRRLIIFYPT